MGETPDGRWRVAAEQGKKPGRNVLGREGKQEERRWEGSHEWRQSDEGDGGEKVDRNERERERESRKSQRRKEEDRSSSVHGMPSGDIVANDSFATRSFL